MHIVWSVLAVEDRTAIFDYLEGESLRAAILVDDRIEAQIDLLADFPNIGRPGRVPGTRELVISGTSFIAAYCVEGRSIRILRVLHGARLWPDAL